MNNSKANGLENAHFSKISIPGLIYVINIRETALYSLEGPVTVVGLTEKRPALYLYSFMIINKTT